ncbi:hypothetical protein [Saccharopolyspora sp. ASAGF58]|uniref:hypothetical protein n=1 Tax=Saccharopolyspora sp. ASAGF58 TaxID=2719023 RepID=UPI0014400309|nr:hypothetical protein [Saccharopolyspora sp. ASAGF58]QIZ36885.1 hypothetical protein FDZ84_22320 [Saccharopolyspora sp. ASAGF58]
MRIKDSTGTSALDELQDAGDVRRVLEVGVPNLTTAEKLVGVTGRPGDHLGGRVPLDADNLRTRSARSMHACDPADASELDDSEAGQRPGIR